MQAPPNTEERMRQRVRVDTTDAVDLATSVAVSALAGAIRILGPVEVCSGEERLPLGGPRQVSALAFLVLHANRAVSSDALIDAVWGHARSRADNCLQMAISRLRRALEPLQRDGRIVLRSLRGGYMLSLQPGTLDAEIFQTRLLEARRALADGAPWLAAEAAGSALKLWRGPALADVAFEDFTQSDIRHLEELQLSALETRIAADLEIGRHQDLVSELEALTLTHPTWERFAWQLMLALYRCGRQVDALESYERVRVQFARDLGLEPGPALKDLQRRILRQDRSLEHAPQPPCSPAAAAVSNRPRSMVQPKSQAGKVSILLTQPRVGVVVSARRVNGKATCDCTRTLDKVRITRWFRVE